MSIKVTTGFPSLDDLLGGGFAGGQLILLAGTSSAGKTSLASNIAVHVACTPGQYTAYFALQMPADKVRYRMMLALSRVDLLYTNPKWITQDDKAKVVEADEILTKSGLVFFNYPSSSAAAIKLDGQKTLVKQGLSLIVVDSRRELHAGQHQYRSEDAAVADGMLKTARALGLPILVIYGLDTPRRIDTRPLTRDIPPPWLAAADIVLGLHSGDKRSAEVIMLKHPSGRTGDVFLVRHTEYCLFEEPGGRRVDLQLV
jgi:replicative DNA helicase